MRTTLAVFAIGIALASLPAMRTAGQSDTGVRLLGDEGEGARYWPRWRGPSGQGLAAGGGYPDRWSATENIRWKVAVPGAGNSSPIVWADKVFLTTAHDNGRRLSLVAFDRAEGKMLWEAIAPDGPRDSPHFKNGYASSTPATDGERIYVSFGGRGLFAFDMSGQLIWRRSLGPVTNHHGAAGSPLLYKQTVILYQDQYRDAYIAAFDVRTGTQVWRTPRQQDIGWGTPIAVRVGDHDEIIVNGQSHVMAYHPETGAELWRCAGTSDEVIPTPVVGYGLVFCSSGRVGPTLAIRPGGRGDVSRTHVAWTTPRGSPFVPSPILYDGQLYTVNDMASIVTSFDATTGKTLWQGRLGVAQREGFSASPVAVDGKIFFTNDDGETFVVKAGPVFQLLHVNQIGESVLASPALVDGVWYVRTSRHLIAIGGPR